MVIFEHFVKPQQLAPCNSTMASLEGSISSLERSTHICLVTDTVCSRPVWKLLFGLFGHLQRYCWVCIVWIRPKHRAQVGNVYPEDRA